MRKVINTESREDKAVCKLCKGRQYVLVKGEKKNCLCKRKRLQTK